MKTILIQYLITWAKLLVMAPALVIASLVKLSFSIYLLFGAAVLGHAKLFDETYDEIVNSLFL